MFGYIQLGDQHAPQQIMGPLVSARQRARVLDYIEIGKREGARLVCGGGKPAHLAKGWWVEPTLFADVRNDMRIAREEIFGPVLVAIAFDDDEDAVRIANDSEYGLFGSIFSAEPIYALRIARRHRTAPLHPNSPPILAPNPP